MMKTIFSKVMWLVRGIVLLAKGTSVVVGLTVIVALTAGVVSQATAANGQSLILGRLNNVATALTSLSANVAGPALQIINNNAATNATALNLATRADRPPMRVTSATKVANLNADKVDGQSLSCPSFHLFHEGVCIETGVRTAATWGTAQADCLGEGKRLPTIEELQTFRNRSGTNFTSHEWSNERDEDGSSPTKEWFFYVDPTSGFVGWNSQFVKDTNAYRCVRQVG
jgi:hypothetical protein